MEPLNRPLRPDDRAIAATTLISDHRIHVHGGAVFARRWQPEPAKSGQPVILLLHDSLGCVELWRGFPEELAVATQLTVIAYDRLGFGRSDPNPRAPDRDFIVDEARSSIPALRAELGIQTLVPFGHSVGGAMAVACAANLPQACVGLITESAQAFVEDRTLNGIRDAQGQFLDITQKQRLARYHGDKTSWVLDAWINTWLAPSFAEWTLDSMLRQVRCPILTMHGDRDEFGSQTHAQRIAACVGGSSTVELFTDCGHVPHREQPGRVITAVTGFLASRVTRAR